MTGIEKDREEPKETVFPRGKERERLNGPVDVEDVASGSAFARIVRRKINRPAARSVVKLTAARLNLANAVSRRETTPNARRTSKKALHSITSRRRAPARGQRVFRGGGKMKKRGIP